MAPDLPSVRWPQLHRAPRPLCLPGAFAVFAAGWFVGRLLTTACAEFSVFSACSTDDMSHDRHTSAKLRHAANGYLLKLQLTSDPNLLSAVRGTVERLTEAFGFTAAEGRAVTRAVDEALTNIIRHAYAGAPDHPIELSFRCVEPRSDSATAGEGLEIVMSDHGPAVDPDKLCGRELADVKPGGLGLHFIRQSMDVVEFKRANDTNSLRLVKYIRASERG